MARTGRRPGNQDTREAILAAARESFAEGGFDRASIRAIASRAGVDPALVHHYFGTKDELFLATVNAPMDPARFVDQVFAGTRDDLPERLVRTFLSVWDHPVTGPAVVALVRTSVQHDWSTRMLREFVAARVIRRVLTHLELDPVEAPLRGTLLATQMIGLGMVRYIVKLEPLASAPPEIVVATVAPTVRRYLFEPLPVAASMP
jgi:AcrR family transcriptional regulator